MPSRAQFIKVNSGRFFLALFYGLYLLAALELFSRVYLAVQFKAPFWKPSDVFYKFYPEVKEAMENSLDKDDGSFDVLILDGSVLNSRLGNIETLLKEELKKTTVHPVRIYNLAMPSFTSLDNYYQYAHLQGKHFDLVIFYQGINEVRANNCPPGMFRKDYSHYGWYAAINDVVRHKEIDYVSFPFVLSYFKTRLLNRFGFLKFLTNGQMPKAWLKYGEDIKTSASFRENTLKVISLAKAKHEPLVLMSLAFYVPDGYSLEGFKEGKFDYGKTETPVEIWGNAENVIKGIEAHNAILKEIIEKESDRNIIFIDQNALFPKNGQYFNDICHFTLKGCRKFVENLGQPLEDYFSKSSES